MMVLEYARAVELLGALGVPFPDGYEVRPGDPVPEIAWTRAVLKGSAPGALHKSELGLVEVGVPASEVPERIAAMRRRAAEQGIALAAVRVEPELDHQLELIVSLRRDPELGLVALIGAGGVLAELVADRIVLLWPKTPEELAQAVRRLRIAPVFAGYRNLPALPVATLHGLLTAVAGALAADAEIAEIELNPLALTVQGVVALDAKVTRRAAAAVEVRSRHAPEEIARLLSPRVIAIAGASRDPSKLGSRLLRALRTGGYPGQVRVVHPSEAEIAGVPCVRSFRDLPEVPDLAAIALGPKETIAMVEEALRAGVRAFLLQGAGFAETGAEGLRLQEKLRDLLRSAGAIAIGPNSQGIVSTPSGLLLSFSRAIEELPRPDGISFVSQSGAVSGTLLSRLWDEGMGLRHWIVTGTEVDVTLPDVLSFFAHDPGTRVVAAYVESLEDKGALHRALAECREAGKPVVVLKACRTEESQELSESHSGRLAGDYALHQAAITDAGGHLAATLPEFLGALRLLASRVMPRGRRLGVVTASGGAAAALIDRAAELGFSVPPLTGALRDALRTILPSFVSVGHPVDLTMAYYRRPEMVGEVLTAMSDSGSYDVIVLILTTNADPEAAEIAAIVASATASMDIPVTVVRMASERLAPNGIQRYREAGIPLFTMPEDAIESLAVLAPTDR